MRGVSGDTDGVFLPLIAAKRVRETAQHVRILGAMTDERLAFEIHPPARPAMGVERRSYVNCPPRVVSAEGTRRALGMSGAHVQSMSVMESLLRIDRDIEASLGAVVVRATSSKASRKGLGNSRPRFSARRRMPAHAFGLKKYRAGI